MTSNLGTPVIKEHKDLDITKTDAIACINRNIAPVQNVVMLRDDQDDPIYLMKGAMGEWLGSLAVENDNERFVFLMPEPPHEGDHTTYEATTQQGLRDILNSM